MKDSSEALRVAILSFSSDGDKALAGVIKQKAPHVPRDRKLTRMYLS